MLSLRDLQLRFSAALAPEPSAPPDPGLLAVIKDGGALGAIERLAIYAGMYRARLVDVLREDFPRVVAVLGDEAFSALASRYIVHHPSTHPSVRHVGGRFVDFVRTEPALPPFLADLAQLEWARVEVFDAADADPLRLADLASVPPDDWAALRFRPIPACRVVECGWPVHELWAAAGAETGEPLQAGPAATIVRVWREEWSVSHVAMGQREARAFRLLQGGESFATLCAALEDDLDPETAAREVASLLLRWIEDGVLAAPGGGS